VHAGRRLEVRSLRHDGEELLVGAGELPASVVVHRRAAGITLLHPWANRLAAADGYRAAGQRVRLAPGDATVGRDTAGLPIHGTLATPSAWILRSCDRRRWVADLDHAGTAGSPFPFPHDLAVEIVLRDAGLEITTTLTATAGTAVPVAFGWHPYLRLRGSRDSWRLGLPARSRLALDAHGIPTGEQTVEPAQDGPLAGRAFDDAYAVVDGATFRLADAHGGALRLRLLSGYRSAHVFAPPALDVVSFEPMTAPVNALASGDVLPVVEPGVAYRALFALDVRRDA
jgi:aldose 1-epimerase